jgi:hypothetical protein
MTEENGPTLEELKAEQAEIPVEEMEEPTKGEARTDVSEALRDLGRQFAETLQRAWQSEERKEFEQDVREGMRRFGDEVNKVIGEARESPAAQRAREEAEEVRTKVESGEFSRKARGTLVEGLQWMSDELAKLAEQFNPPEKGPETIDDQPETAPEEPEA